MPIEISDHANILVGKTGITTFFTSDGHAYWDNLPEDQKEAIKLPLNSLKSWLMDQFLDPPAVPANLLAARSLALGMVLNQQTDPDTCTYVAVANAMRILGEPNPEYSLGGLQQRMTLLYGTSHDQLTPASLDSILRSGEPFDKFRLLRIPDPITSGRPYPMDMFQLLKKLRDGAIAILDWPYSPIHTRRNDVDYTHARTVTGFTGNSHGLFFHFVDPYINQWVKVYSFRDLMAACLCQSSDFESGVITPDSIDRVARGGWIIERAPSPIKTLS